MTCSTRSGCCEPTSERAAKHSKRPHRDIDLDVVWQVIDRDAVLIEALLADLSRDLHDESD
jgi:hypothetical protein